jgi:hypothetical protein
VVKVRVHEQLASLHATADGDLMQTAGPALNQRNSVVHPVISDQAAVYSKKAVRAPPDEADLTTRLGRESHVVSVTPWILRPYGRRDRRLLEATDPPQLLDYELSLELKLPIVRHVLPLAAAAFAKVLARRLDPAGRGLENLDDTPEQRVRSLDVDLGHDALARHAVIHKYLAAFILGGGGAIQRKRTKRQLSTDRRLKSL